MGRGGRSGGGGRSFSSGGSRGFSSHSSSRSRGGFSGGYSRSSGGGFHGGYHSGNYNRSPGYYGGFRPRNNFYFRSPWISFDPLSFLLRTMRNIIVGIVFFVIIGSMAVSKSSGSDITKSTVERTKLDPQYVNETSEYYSDNLNWIGSGSTLKMGLKEFYRETGVQPYLYICDNIDGKRNGNYTEYELEAYGNKLYDSLFDDEGHVLVVFCEYAHSQYTTFCTVGTAAKTVLDEEAREILLDYIDHYYYSNFEDEEFFSIAFEDAGERIMTVQKNNTWIAVVVVVFFIGLIFLLKWLERRHDRKVEEMKAAKDILNTPLNEFSDDSVEDLAGKYENK